MAITIESNRQRNVRQAPVSAQKQVIDTPADAFGAGSARALQQGGTALGRFADDMGNRELKVLDKVNRARALDLENQMQRELNSFLYDPNEGLLKRKGADAISSEALMQAKLDEVKKKYIGQPNEAQDVNTMLQNKFTSLETTYGGMATRHAFGETENYEKDALQSSIEFNREEAALDFLNEDTMQEKLQDSLTAIEIRGDLEGWSSDRLKLEKQRETSTMRSAQITAMIATDRPHNIILAKQEFEAGKQRGDFVFDQALKMETALNAAVPKAAAQLKFEQLGTGEGGVVGRENIIGTMVDKIEGGATIAQEPRGAIAKFGINSEANPDVDVANLTREGSIEIYKKRYWDKYNIDDVPENLQFLAFDIAVNHRSDFAKVLIEELGSGNMDAQSALAYRLDEYRRLVRSDPGEYAKYWDGWQGRLEEVSKITGGNKTPSINDVTAAADQLNKIHPDAGDELLKMYDSQQKQIAQIEKARKAEYEDEIHEKVALAGGDYTVLSAAERAEAAEMGIDYTKYTGVSNPDTINDLDAMTADQLFSVDLEEYRGEMTFEDLNKYKTKQAELQKPENKIVQDKIDEAARYYFRAELSQDPDNKNVKPKVAAMKRFIQDQLQARYESMGEVTDKDINEISATFFKNKVYDPSGLFNRQDNVYLMNVNEIPEGIRASIEASLNNDGQLVTENAIKERYIMHLSNTGELQRNAPPKEKQASKQQFPALGGAGLLLQLGSNLINGK